jgi:hypothetical protein
MLALELVFVMLVPKGQKVNTAILKHAFAQGMPIMLKSMIMPMINQVIAAAAPPKKSQSKLSKMLIEFLRYSLVIFGDLWASRH